MATMKKNSRRNTRVKRGAVNTRKPYVSPWMKAWRTFLFTGKSLLFFCLIAGFALIWQASAEYVVDEGWLNIKQLEVEGNSRVTTQEIWHFAGISEGEYIFDVDLQAAETGIKNNPWIKRINLMRRLPDRIVAEIEEYQVAAIIDLPTPLYVDSEGVPFKVADLKDSNGYLTIKGLDKLEFEKGGKGAEKVRMALMLAEEYRNHEANRISPLKSLSLTHSGIEIEIGSTPTRVVLGNVAFVEKFDRLTKLLKHFNGQSSRAALIHLDNDGNPERVTARLLEDEKKDKADN